MYLEPLIMQKSMDLSNNLATLITHPLKHPNNVKNQLKNARNLKSQITVFRQINKILNKKSLITDLLFLLFLSIETS